MIGMMQLLAHAALAYLSLDEMVAAGEHVLEQGTLEQLASRRQRFAIAADAALSLEYGAYGEFPVRSMAQILQHPLVRAAAESPSRELLGLSSPPVQRRFLRIQRSSMRCLPPCASTRSTRASRLTCL